MGLTVEENDLRLFVLCANEDEIDRNRLTSIKTVQSQPESSKQKSKENAKSESENNEMVMEPTRRHSHSKKKESVKEKSHSSGSSSSGLDFESAVTKCKSKKKVKTTPNVQSSSEVDEEIERRVCAAEKRMKLEETNRMATLLGLDVKCHPKDDIVDIRRKHDWVMRENSVKKGINTIMFWIPLGATMIEKFIVSKMPFLEVNGWSRVIIQIKGYLHQPLEALWRRHMLMFGMNMDPLYVLCLIIFGSMMLVMLCNKFDMNSIDVSSSAVSMFCTFVGVTKVNENTPSNTASVVQPVKSTPPPPPPAAVPPPVTTQPTVVATESTGRRPIRRPNV